MDSLFGKFVGWCSGRDFDSISGPLSEVVNVLAHLLMEATNTVPSILIAQQSHQCVRECMDAKWDNTHLCQE